MFDFDKVIEKSLRTWYPKSHNLHLNPHHPLGKLAGEWGELLDDYMKSIYKPGYELEPVIELGDIWYYLRILAYQGEFEFRTIDSIVFPALDIEIVFSLADTEVIISAMAHYANELFLSLLVRGYTNMTAAFIYAQYSGIVEIGSRYGLSIQEITGRNWEKLKPGSERGKQWMKARIETDYVNIGKVGKL